MKKIVWQNPDLMRIETGVKAFDSKCDLLTVGNVISNVLYGQYLRGRNNCSCNGFSFEAGHLQASDTRFLSESSVGAYQKLLRVIKKHVFFEKNDGWYYIVRHFRRDGAVSVPVIHGALLTSFEHQKVLRLDRDQLGLNALSSSIDIMDAAVPYLCMEG